MTETKEQLRARKTAEASKRRLDPAYRQKTNARKRVLAADGRYDKNYEAWKTRARKEFFPWHIRFVRRINKSITEDDIRMMWEAQDGLCALTGIVLVPNLSTNASHLSTAWDEPHIDHIVPVSRGGTHELSNLRWVCAAVNLAKRDLLDEEFLDLCRSVVEIAK